MPEGGWSLSSIGGDLIDDYVSGFDDGPAVPT
jgi:hypothetical protein